MTESKKVQQLEAHEVPLHKVFSSDYDFVIPHYQRAYAWGTDQAEQLLQDLNEALEQGDDEPYFLGSIVLVKERGVPHSEVIDGQQRLTTLTILLSVLRHLADEPGIQSSIDKMIRDDGDAILEIAPKPRLRLREVDATFFAERVQQPGGLAGLLASTPDMAKTDPQRAVRANAIALEKQLRSWTSHERNGLTKLIASRTYLVVVSTPNLASAHRIFSVMNARGLDLSPADIFKADQVGQLDAAESLEYSARWEAAEEMLGREEFADLFLHIRMIFAKERARRELLREFPEQVIKPHFEGNTRGFIDDVVIPYAEAQAEINSLTYQATEAADLVNLHLRHLRNLDNNDWRPPALWALRHHHDEPRLLEALLRNLERLAASMFIRRAYTTPRVMRYGELLKQLESGDGVASEAFELTAEERDDTLQRLDGELYPSARVCKFVLLRVDEILSREAGAQVVHHDEKVTIEHVLPQNPAEGSDWLQTFDEDERALWVHRLGNLLILNRARNSAAGRADFDKKKSGYFVGTKGVPPFALTAQVLAKDEWTPTTLVDRQEKLIGLLRQEWALD